MMNWLSLRAVIAPNHPSLFGKADTAEHQFLIASTAAFMLVKYSFDNEK
jgi:hypothetical protein